MFLTLSHSCNLWQVQDQSPRSREMRRGIYAGRHVLKRREKGTKNLLASNHRPQKHQAKGQSPSSPISFQKSVLTSDTLMVPSQYRFLTEELALWHQARNSLHLYCDQTLPPVFQLIHWRAKQTSRATALRVPRHAFTEEVHLPSFMVSPCSSYN